MMPTHEIPTHLHSTDRVLAGCTWSQLLTLGSGTVGAFWAWQALHQPHTALLAGCAVPLLVAVTAAFWRPDGHGLLTWFGLAAAHALAPRRLVWRQEAAPLTLLVRPAGQDATVQAAGAGQKVAGQSVIAGPGPLIEALHATRGVSGPARRPARRRGGLLSVPLGQHVLCLCTYHRRPVWTGERG